MKKVVYNDSTYLADSDLRPRGLDIHLVIHFRVRRWVMRREQRGSCSPSVQSQLESHVWLMHK